MLNLNIQELDNNKSSIKLNTVSLDDKDKGSVPISASKRPVNLGPDADLLMSSKWTKSPSKKKSMDINNLNDSINEDLMGDMGNNANKGFDSMDLDEGISKVKFSNEPTIIGDKNPLSSSAFPETIKLSGIESIGEKPVIKILSK